MSAPVVEAIPAAAAERRTPYQGLVPYTEADADWFFGRDEWCEVVGDNLRAYRITVLYGTSGVGKSSVLRAGLLRRLADEARGNVADFGTPRLLPVVFSGWSLDDPLVALKEAVAAAARGIAPELQGKQAAGSLADVLEAWPERIEGPLLLVLDQFEEFFLYHDRPGDPALDEVAAALRRRSPSVHFLLSIREDSLAKLDRFKGHVPGLLDHLLRIDQLDRAAAREAIVLPLERWSAQTGEEVEAEPALVEALLDQVTAGQVSLAEAGTATAALAHEAAEGIVAPYLQLVLERLWDEEHRRWQGHEPAEPRLLRLETLDQLGGAEKIVRTHLDAALAAMPQREQDVAGRVFRQLVTPSGTKIALRVSDLAQLTELPEERIEPLVEQLTGDVRILRGAGEERYEIYHDALSGPILDWSARWQERQRRRRERRRLIVLGAVAAVLAGIAALVALFAVQANHAKDNARLGQSSALAGQAIASLETDPVSGLRLAIQAEETSATGRAESALRAALAAPLRRTLHVPGGAVHAAALSPNGKLVVTIGSDGKARLWDVASGRSVRTLNGKFGGDDNEFGAAFSPDGTRVVTPGARGNGARVWDVSSGRSLTTLGGRGGAFSEAAFVSDRILAVTTTHDVGLCAPRGGGCAVSRTVTTGAWDIATGAPLRSFRLPSSVVASFRRNGEFLDGYDAIGARIWRVASDGSRRRIGGADAVVGALSPAGKRAVTVPFDGGTARIWDVATGRGLRTLPGYTLSAAFSPDGKRILTADDDETARIWDVHGNNLETLAGHTGPINTAAFSANGRTVVTASADGTARIWEVATAGVPTLVNDKSRKRLGPVLSATFSPDDKLVLVSYDNGTVRLWDFARGGLLHVFRGSVGEATDGVFSPNGKLVAVASGNTAQIWDIAGRRRHHTLRGQARDGYMASVAFSPDGKLVVTGGSDLARIWDVGSGESRQTLKGHSDGADDAQFSADGKFVVTAGSDGTARIWDVATGRNVRTLGREGAAELAGAVFTPDGKLVVTEGLDVPPRIWDVATGRRLHILSGSGSVLSPDGKLVVTATGGGTLRFWDVTTGRSVQTLDGTTAAFSPDSRYVVTTGDGTATIRDVASGRRLQTLPGAFSTGDFSSDGTRVVTGSEDGSVRIWACGVCGVSVDQLIDRARNRLAAIR